MKLILCAFGFHDIKIIRSNPPRGVCDGRKCRRCRWERKPIKWPKAKPSTH